MTEKGAEEQVLAMERLQKRGFVYYLSTIQFFTCD